MTDQVLPSSHHGPDPPVQVGCLGLPVAAHVPQVLGAGPDVVAHGGEVDVRDGALGAVRADHGREGGVVAAKIKEKDQGLNECIINYF